MSAPISTGVGISHAPANATAMIFVYLAIGPDGRGFGNPGVETYVFRRFITPNFLA